MNKFIYIVIILLVLLIACTSNKKEDTNSNLPILDSVHIDKKEEPTIMKTPQIKINSSIRPNETIILTRCAFREC